MSIKPFKRQGLSLIESLIAFAILAVVISLLMTAVIKTRNTAMRIEASNHMRQVLIASHSYAERTNCFPDIDGNNVYRDRQGASALLALFPYLGGYQEAPPTLIRFRSDPSISETIRRYTPTGPMLNATFLPIPIPPDRHVASIALNPFLYSKSMKFPHQIRDGQSTTIALTEHYGSCSKANFEWVSAQVDCYGGPPFVRVHCSSETDRRATFADGKMFQDVVPVTIMGPNGPKTHGSSPMTFQVRPTLEHCDPRIPQSTFAGGILCGMADGSVRFVQQDISESIFWGSVTPDQGEIAPID